MKREVLDTIISQLQDRKLRERLSMLAKPRFTAVAIENNGIGLGYRALSLASLCDVNLPLLVNFSQQVSIMVRRCRGTMA